MSSLDFVSLISHKKHCHVDQIENEESHCEEHERVLVHSVRGQSQSRRTLGNDYSVTVTAVLDLARSSLASQRLENELLSECQDVGVLQHGEEDEAEAGQDVEGHGRQGGGVQGVLGRGK